MWRKTRHKKVVIGCLLRSTCACNVWQYSAQSDYPGIIVDRVQYGEIVCLLDSAVDELTAEIKVLTLRGIAGWSDAFHFEELR